MAVTKTIGQLDTEVSPAQADYIEIEHSGVSGKISLSTLVDTMEATSAEALAGSSSTVVITPLALRQGLNANNAAPVYGCRAWCYFDGTTTSASLVGAYSRAVGSTLTVIVATTHSYISGNVASLVFNSGGASNGTYIVNVIDSNTFTVNTVATTSVPTSVVTLRRCPITGGGNVNSVSYCTAGAYIVNYAVALPSAYSFFYHALSGSGVWDYDALHGWSGVTAHWLQDSYHIAFVSADSASTLVARPMVFSAFG